MQPRDEPHVMTRTALIHAITYRDPDYVPIALAYRMSWRIVVWLDGCLVDVGWAMTYRAAVGWCQHNYCDHRIARRT